MEQNVQVVDAQPLRATGVVRLNEPAEVVLAVILTGTAAAAAETSIDPVALCPPLAQMKEALEEGAFVLRDASLAVKLSTESHADLQMCAPTCSHSFHDALSNRPLAHWKLPQGPFVSSVRARQVAWFMTGEIPLDRIYMCAWLQPSRSHVLCEICRYTCLLNL